MRRAAFVRCARGPASRPAQVRKLRPVRAAQDVSRPLQIQFDVARCLADVVERLPGSAVTLQDVVHTHDRTLAFPQMNSGRRGGEGKPGPHGGNDQSSGEPPDQVRPHRLLHQGRDGGPNHDRQGAGPQRPDQPAGVDQSTRGGPGMVPTLKARGHGEGRRGAEVRIAARPPPLIGDAVAAGGAGRARRPGRAGSRRSRNGGADRRSPSWPGERSIASGCSGSRPCRWCRISGHPRRAAARRPHRWACR